MRTSAATCIVFGSVHSSAVIFLADSSVNVCPRRLVGTRLALGQAPADPEKAPHSTVGGPSTASALFVDPAAADATGDQPSFDRRSSPSQPIERHQCQTRKVSSTGPAFSPSSGNSEELLSFNRRTTRLRRGKPWECAGPTRGIRF
jgi:hypothetical protein